MALKIAIIRPDSNTSKKGYYNSQELGLAKGFAKLGYETHIYMATNKKEIIKTTISQPDGQTIIIIELPHYLIPQISLAIFPSLIKELKNNQYDLIQVNEDNELTCFQVARYAHKNNIKCVVYQGMYKNISGRINRAYQMLFDTFLLPSFKNYISYSFCKTTRAQAHLIKKGYTNTHVIPVGLDTEAFQSNSHFDWKEQLSIKNKKILLYIGIFESRRNIVFLIDLAKKLAIDNYDLILAGKGPLLNQIETKISEEKLENVHLIGEVKQSELVSLYQIADFFLLASSYEIYGMVILEAMYFGCPVISTKTAGAEDIIEPGKNGFIINTLDATEWSSIIKDNYQSLDRNQIVSIIANNLVWDIIAKRYIEIAFKSGV
jgi:glycosyltransferase involved in cell wall biosynthesis